MFAAYDPAQSGGVASYDSGEALRGVPQFAYDFSEVQFRLRTLSLRHIILSSSLLLAASSVLYRIFTVIVLYNTDMMKARSATVGETNLDCQARLTVLCVKALNDLISYRASDTGKHTNDYRPDCTCRKRRTGIQPLHHLRPHRAVLGSVVMPEKLGPETLAYTLVEHAHATDPEPQEYLTRVVAELFGIEPAVRQRFMDLLVTDLKEEIVRREDPKYARATVELIERIEQDWRNERG
jgi:hypothetical protein